jgi:hypothetical protein
VPGYYLVTGWGSPRASLIGTLSPLPAQSCPNLVLSLRQMIAEGIRLPEARWPTVNRELGNCLAAGYITRLQYDETIAALESGRQTPPPGPPPR